MSTLSNTRVWFGNNSITNSQISLTSLDIISSTAKDLQTQELNRASGSSVIRNRYQSRSINVSGGVSPNSLTENRADVLNLTDKVKSFFSKDDRYLRIVPTSRITVLDDCQSVTGWTASSDATNVTLDENEFSYESASVAFDVDVSASGDDFAVISKTLSTAIDLSGSAVSDNGNFEVELYLQDVYFVSSIELRIGNDGSNYYSTTFTNNYESKPFENGWNLLSMKWGDSLNGLTASETGTVNNSAIDYIYIKINYTSEAEDFKAKVGSVYHAQESYVRNYPCYVQDSITFDADWYKVADNVSSDFEYTLLNYTGFSIATHDIELFNVTGIATASNTQKVEIHGTGSPRLNNTFTLNDSTNLTDLRYTNLNLNETIQWTNTWADNDVVNFDKSIPIVTRNGQPQDFVGKLPDAIKGTNYLKMQVVTGASITIESLTSNAEREAINKVSDTANLYQSFTTTSAGTLNSISVKIRADALTGNPFTVFLIADSGGTPGSIITLQNVNPTSTTSTVYTANFNQALTAATVYWIGVIAPIDQSCFWAEDTTQPYAGGKGYQVLAAGGPPVGSDTNSDFYFSVNIEPTPSTDIDWNCKYKPIYL